MIIGLTGQSGAGKTTVSDIFKSEGFYIINADAISREVSMQQNVLLELQNAFGSEVVQNGMLNRRLLGSLVFSNRELLDKLNAIMFPKIMSEIKRQIEKCQSQFILLDAPQLFESGADKLCTAVVAVTAPKTVLISRIMKRDGISYSDAVSRLQSQLPHTFFRQNARFVIENDGDTYSLIEKTNVVIAEIRGNIAVG